MINTRFWVDPWVQESLNSLDRFLFLYLLTNDQTNLCGIYEISNFKMCFETGIEKETLLRAMFPRLEPKVYREGNWVILVNFPKHQNTNNPSIIQGILRELDLVPTEVVEKAIEHGYEVPLGYKKGGTRGVEGTPNLTKPNLLADASAPLEVVEVSEKEETPKAETRTKDKLAIYTLFSSKEQPWWRHKQQKVAALSLFDLLGVEKVQRGLRIMREHLDDPLCPQASTPFEYEEKLPKLTRYAKRLGI